MNKKTLALTGLSSILALCVFFAGAPALAQSASATYEKLHARYAAERAAFHRGVWPYPYPNWSLVDIPDETIIDAHFASLDYSHPGQVDYIRVGQAKDVARGADGQIAAVYVQLFNGKGVWVDQGDLRHDRGNSLLMTNIDRADLAKMSDEQP